MNITSNKFIEPILLSLCLITITKKFFIFFIIIDLIFRATTKAVGGKRSVSWFEELAKSAVVFLLVRDTEQKINPFGREGKFLLRITADLETTADAFRKG